MYVVLIDKISKKIIEKVKCNQKNAIKIKYQMEINLDLSKYEIKIIK